MTANARTPSTVERFDYEQYQDHLDIVRTFGPTARFMDRVIRRVGARLEEMRVLDLGCGTGHISRMFEERNTVVSYDPALQGVKITRARRARPGGFAVGGGEHLPFRDAAFDAVLLIDVLEHIPDHRQVAREILRVLRPGGYVFCMVPENMRLYSRIDAANGHVRRYSRDELLDVFAPCAPEVLFDYGFPFMRLYLALLAPVHDTVVPQTPPTGLRRAALRALSAALTALFSIDLLFAGWFRGVELVALLRKPALYDPPVTATER
jgi:ubiquinone/menaquinone biosynthesis C-methylase UbiE